MRRLLWTVSLGFLVCLFAASSARAVGLGFYGEVGGGNSEWELDFDSGGEEDFDADTSHAGFGFVLDTAVSTDRVFNYRLNVGYDRFANELEDGGDDVDFDGLVIDNTFGFGIVRTPEVRLWIGPQIRFAAYSGSPDGAEDLDITLGAFGLGPVLGLNLNVGPVATLAFELGIRWIGYAGEGEWDDGSNDDFDVSISEGMLFLNAAMLFRTGERF